MKDPKNHGISIGIQRVKSEFFLYFKAIGCLTHDDYEQITPLIDFALQSIREPRVKVLVDIKDFEGWEVRAAWDDFKLGLKHGNQFSRIAILGDEKWQKIAVHIASWFIDGEMEFFDEEDDALEWLLQPIKEKTEEHQDKERHTPIFPAH